MGLTEALTGYITDFISFTGYIGIAVLMMFESMIAPVPSEAVMPFAGFLINEGRFSWFGVTMASTSGTISGSLLSYYMGKYGGRPFIKKFGKYLLLDEHHLDLTEKFFNKYGDKAIFISRFIPIVRHLISIPAGVGNMNVAKFVVYTAVGGTIWNMFLAYVGFKLKEHWELIHEYDKYVDLVALFGLSVFAAYLFYKLYKSAKRKKDTVNKNEEVLSE